MSKSRSREFLKKLSETQSFDEATGKNFWRRDPDHPGDFVRDTGRMMNRELALRFCAFRNFSIDEYRQYPSLDSYLVEYTRRLDGRSDVGAAFTEDDLEKMEGDFSRAMNNAQKILGKAAFRRWPTGLYRRGPINRAVFESQALALADYQLDELLPKKEEVTAAFRALFDDSSYARAVTVGTGDPLRVDIRLKRTKAVLQQVVK